MSVVIVGGNERMERQYKDICEQYNYDVKVLTKMTGTSFTQNGKKRAFRNKRTRNGHRALSFKFDDGA